MSATQEFTRGEVKSLLGLRSRVTGGEAISPTGKAATAHSIGAHQKCQAYFVPYSLGFGWRGRLQTPMWPCTGRLGFQYRYTRSTRSYSTNYHQGEASETTINQLLT